MGATKQIAIQMQDDLMQQINDAEIGNINHLDTFLNLRDARFLLQQSMDLIKSYEQDNRDYIMNEANDYPEGYKGFTFKEVNGRTMFSYKEIPQWKQAKKDLSEIESLYKTAFQQKLKGMQTVTNDGELIDIFPDVSYAKNSIRLTKVKR